MSDTGLSVRQERFVDLVFTGMTPTDAYEKIYGCTRQAAASSAPRLMKNPEIARAIGERRAELRQAAIDSRKVVEILFEIASDPDARNVDRVSACKTLLNHLPKDSAAKSGSVSAADAVALMTDDEPERPARGSRASQAGVSAPV